MFINDININPNVVVLIPPAVDTGDAPIIIKIIKHNIELWWKELISNVLNPAVRALTDWKNDIESCSNVDKSAKLFVCSVKKRNIVPKIISPIVTLRANVVCILSDVLDSEK